MKTCFSEGKLMKQFGNPALSKTTPPFQLNPLFLSNFFMKPLCGNFQNKNPRPPNFRGGGNYAATTQALDICVDYFTFPTSLMPFSNAFTFP